MPRTFYWDRKTTTEEALDLSIFRLNKWSLLSGFTSSTLTWRWRLSGRKCSIGIIVDVRDNPYVRLQYTKTDQEGNKKDFDYQVPLVTTPCNFGGKRYWFCCRVCGKKVGCLYLGKEYFICRTCADLTYESRNESRMGRPGGIGHFIVSDRKIEELMKNIKREYYAGKPTRKYKRVLKLMDHDGSMI